MPRVLLIGTVETKRAELTALAAALARHGLVADQLDISLRAGGQVLSDAEKLALMDASRTEAVAEGRARAADCLAAVAIGGGTGAEIALAVLRELPPSLPKVMLTTLAFDPRAALADNAVMLVPTLCDIEGVNATLARAFETTAAMVAGLAAARPLERQGRPGIAVTTLGATGPAGTAVARFLAERGCEATVFHANGFGGAAFSRFVREGHADAAIDLNLHELGRLRLAGACVPMPDRFTATGALPRVVLPGALNFLGFGKVETVPAAYLDRPHYRHSGHFTHVKLTEVEMAGQAAALADTLNTATGDTHVLIPMGGFSHQDRPGGAIEDLRLREVFADGIEGAARGYTTQRLPDHINSAETALAAVDALLQRMPHA